MEECRKNLLIKEFIIPNLESFDKHNNSPCNKNKILTTYNVETLKLEGKSFFRSDFISKFISMNKNVFHTLHLKHVHFDENIQDLVYYLKTEKTKIKNIILEDCNIGNSSICSMIADCKTI